MATSPIENILPPIDSGIKQHLENFGKLVDEIIAFGTHVLSWHMQTAKGGDEIAPITLSIRHILELIGAISSSIKNSNVESCKILLRAMLESLLGLEYILKEDTVRRGFAFLTVESHQRLKHYKAIDPSTKENAQLRRLIEGDKIVPDFKLKIPEEVLKVSIAAIEDFLETPGARAASAELQKCKQDFNKNPYWYSLYGGPTNLERLAAYLGCQIFYQFLYRYWSGSTHGTDIIQGKIGFSSSGRPGIVQLRLPKEAQTITQFTITFALRMFKLVISKYNTDKQQEFTEWYKKEIRDFYLDLSKKNFFDVTLHK
jgi:hypothetical protein